MKEEDSKNFIIESKGKTTNMSLSKAKLMEKAREEMNTKYGLKGVKVKPQQCTIIFKSE